MANVAGSGSDINLGKLRGASVVVVDPAAASECVASDLLAIHGCSVRRARSAEEALVLVNKWSPVVVVTDLILPRMSGLLLARQLKADPATRQTVIVGVGDFPSPDISRIAKEVGCVAYFLRPIDARLFAVTIAALLDGHESTANAAQGDGPWRG